MSRTSRLVTGFVSVVVLAVTGVAISLHQASASHDSNSAVSGLPPHTAFGGNIYSRSKRIKQLPSNVIRVGSTAGGGKLYAPREGAGPANPAHVKTVWVSRDQQIWSYTLLTELALH